MKNTYTDLQNRIIVHCKDANRQLVDYEVSVEDFHVLKVIDVRWVVDSSTGIPQFYAEDSEGNILYLNDILNPALPEDIEEELDEHLVGDSDD